MSRPSGLVKRIERRQGALTRGFVTAALSRGGYDPAGVEAVAEGAADAANHGFPLAAVERANQLGHAYLWAALQAEAHGDENSELLALVPRFLSSQHTLSSAIMRGYFVRSEPTAGGITKARRVLSEALLSGVPPEPLAIRAGMTLPSSYVMLAVRLERSEHSPVVVDTFESWLAEHDDQGVLGVLDGRPGPGGR